MEMPLKILNDIIRARLQGKPYKLNFSLTNKCNSRCTHCRIWQLPPSNVEELSLEEIGFLFKSLPCTIFWLALSGGEPFLREDIKEIIDSANRNIRNLSILSIATNGTCTNNIMDTLHHIRRYSHIRFYVTFSVDGPENINDTIRGLKGVFRKTLDTYMKAKKVTSESKNIHFLFESTMNVDNLPYMEGFLQSKPFRGNTILTLLHQRDYYNNLADDFKQITDMRLLRRICALVKRNGGYSLQGIVQGKYLDKLTYYLQNPQKQVLDCTALRDSLAIDPYGNITPCFMWKNHLGCIRDYHYDIGKMWQLGSFKIIRDKIRKGKCPNCWTPCEAYTSIIGSFLNPFSLLRVRLI